MRLVMRFCLVLLAGFCLLAVVCVGAPYAADAQLSGSISGVVYDDHGNPLANAEVWAEYWDSGGGAGGTKTDGSGNYTIEGLAGGQYRVVAGASGRVKSFYGNTLSPDNAVPVVVTAGLNTSNISFTLEPGGTVSGAVYDDQGNPLAGISLNCYGYPLGATSGSDGSYTITGVPFGQYKVTAPDPGRWGPNDSNWVREFYNDKNSEDLADLVAISADSPNAIGINFTLTQGGSISGIVYDNMGSPLAGADVLAEYYENRDWAAGARTDENGAYTIQGLAGSQYRVAAWFAGRVMEFYNNTLIYNQATSVNVTIGQTTAGINFSLEPGGTISGTVTDGQGNPLAGISVNCVNNDGVGNGTETGSDGTYTIRGLPFGNYKVNAPGGWGPNDGSWSQEWYNQKTGWDQADTVTIAAYSPNTTGINFSLEPGGDLTRAELAKMLTEKLGLPIYLPASPTFSDVPLDYWAAGYIYSSVKEGILSGFEDGTFRPEFNPTRARFAQLLYRTFNIPEYIPGSPTYSDVLPVHEAYEAIESLTHAGIVGGYPDGTFRPDGTIEEAGAAIIFERLTNYCGSITGIVTNEQGIPITGANVWAEGFSGVNGKGTQTDSNGLYTIRGLSGGQYRVGAEAANRLRKFYNNTLIYDQATLVYVITGQNTAGINFSLEPGGSVSGVVYDSLNHPLAGVSVECERVEQFYSSRVQTLANGSYTITGLPFGTYKVSTPVRGGANDGIWVKEWYNGKTLENQADLVTISIASTNVTGLNFTLEPGGSISGRVIDDQGRPLAGVNVWARYWLNGGFADGARTDGEGNYTIGSLASGQYQVGAELEGWVRRIYDNTLICDQAVPVNVTIGQDTAGINFSLEPGGSVSGVVYDSLNHPLAGISVNCGRIDRLAGWGDLTRPDGTYNIIGLPFGSYKVCAPGEGGPNDGIWVREWYNGKANWDQPDLVSISAASPDAVGVNFSLTQGGTVSGVVYDDRGKPLANADVGLEYYESGDWVSGTQTDGSGSYTFEGLPGGRYRIRAEAAGYVQKYYDKSMSRDNAAPLDIAVGQVITGINFILESGGTISGTVYDKDGNPLAGISLNSWRADGYPLGVQTREDGTYTITGLPFGDYKVSAREGWGANDGTWARAWYNGKTLENQADLVTISFASPNASGVNFTLQQGGIISGIVTSEMENPLANADVWVEYYESGEWAGGARTDENGAYTIQGLTGGQYRVTAWSAGRVMELYNNMLIYDQAVSVNVTIGQTTAGINFSLEPGGTISGVVTDGQGNPLGGISVNCVNNDGVGNGTKTGLDGTYTIRGLPFGNYTVNAPGGWGPNDGSWLQEWYNQKTGWDQADLVTISADNRDALGINFSLTQGGRITGTVTDGQGNPLVDALVFARYWDNGLGEFQTNADAQGHYTLSGLPGGEYRVIAVAPGRAVEFYQDASSWDNAAPVLVTVGQDMPNINFTLEPAGTVKGQILDNLGNPLEGVRVDMIDSEGKNHPSSVSDSDGIFNRENVYPGTYTLRFSNAQYRYLVKKITGVSVTAGVTTNVGTVILTAGDVNGDNTVNTFDLVLLAQSYGRTQEQQGYNEYCDLNGDAVVDFKDLIILAKSYDLSGD